MKLKNFKHLIFCRGCRFAKLNQDGVWECKVGLLNLVKPEEILLGCSIGHSELTEIYNTVGGVKVYLDSYGMVARDLRKHLFTKRRDKLTQIDRINYVKDVESIAVNDRYSPLNEAKIKNKLG